MVKIFKKTKGKPILPTLKEKKRYLLFRLSKDDFAQVKKTIIEYLGLENSAKAGLMHLKEFDFTKNKNYFFVLKSNPKFISNINAAIVFNKYDFDVDIVKVFGNVKKLKDFDLPTIKKNNFDIVVTKHNKYNFDKIYQINKDILMVDSLDFKEKKQDYFFRLKSYEGIDLIKTYQALKNKPFAFFGLETNKKSDFLRFRNSNMNQVVAKFFADKKIFYGIDLGMIQNAKNKQIILGRVFQNLKLCKKYKIPVLIASLDGQQKNSHNVLTALESFKISTLLVKDIYK